VFADGEVPEELRRRRRKPIQDDTGVDGSSEDTMAEGRRRECPVPKPGGLVGQVLGLQREEGRLPDVRIERASDRRRRADDQVTD